MLNLSTKWRPLTLCCAKNSALSDQTRNRLVSLFEGQILGHVVCRKPKYDSCSI